MGAIKKILDNPITEEQKQTIQILEELANNKAEIMQMNVLNSIRTAGTIDNPSVPVDIIIDNKKYVHSYVSVGSNIGKTVKDSINGFVSSSKSNIIDGIGNLLDNGLTILLGSGISRVGEYRDYYLIPSRRGILRVDVAIWYRDIETQSLKQYIEKIIAAVAVKSIADLPKVSLYSFSLLYEKQLEKLGLSDDEIDAEILEAEETYKRLTGGIGSRSEISRVSILPASGFAVA